MINKINWNKWIIKSIKSQNNDINEKVLSIIKFIFNWFEYCEYAKERCKCNGDEQKMINSVLCNSKATIWWREKKDEIIKSLGEIECTCIKDMRYPEDEKKYKFLDEKHSELGDFLKILYQIRCNLFHGEKYPDPSPNDLKILCWAGKRLEELLILINDETIAK